MKLIALFSAAGAFPLTALALWTVLTRVGANDDGATGILIAAPPIGLLIGFVVTRVSKELRISALGFGALSGAALSLLTELRAFPEEGIASALYRSLMLMPLLVMVAAALGGALAYIFWSDKKLDLNFGYETFIGLRYLRSLRGSVLSVVTSIALVGVVLGVALMILSLGVLSGFEGDLIEKIIGADSHLTVSKHAGYLFDHEDVDNAVKAAAPQGIKAHASFVSAEVLVASDSSHTEAKLLGIEPGQAARDVFGVFGKLIKGTAADLDRRGKPMPLLPPPTEDPSIKRVELPTKKDQPPLEIFPEKHPFFETHGALPGIVIGAEMARTLHVDVGDAITVVSPLVEELTPQGPAPKAKAFRVAALFDIRMYSVDAHYAYILLPEAQRFLELGEQSSGVAFQLEDPLRAERAETDVVKALGGYPFQALSWQQRNKSLFMSLKLEKAVAFVVLIFIVLVASFSIVNTLTMSVIEKAREIAILKTMGSKDVSISRLFVVQGAVVGAIGTAIGALVGCLLAIGLSKINIGVGEDVYYMDHLPVRLHTLDVLQVCLLTLVLTTLSAVFPALSAARLSPVEGLRYE